MGGYLNHNKKNYSERRNHGLSLTNLTHCISPSEYYNDYYNNDSFNEINLQLHASSVSNPYSFSIKSNTSFSGVAQAALPATKTLLARTTHSGLLQINIPNGVNVLEVVFDDTNDEFYEENPPYGWLYNNLNKKYWSILQGSRTDSTVWEILYVGVTPNKSYTLNVNFGHSGSLELHYSSEINTHTPNITDY